MQRRVSLSWSKYDKMGATLVTFDVCKSSFKLLGPGILVFGTKEWS